MIRLPAIGIIIFCENIFSSLAVAVPIMLDGNPQQSGLGQGTYLGDTLCHDFCHNIVKCLFQGFGDHIENRVQEVTGDSLSYRIRFWVEIRDRVPKLGVKS